MGLRARIGGEEMSAMKAALLGAGIATEVGCCRFVGVTGAGSRPFCLSSIDSLLRRSGGSGSLIPAEGCPVWSGE